MDSYNKEIRIATLEDSMKGAKLLLNFHKAANPPFDASAAWALALFQEFVNAEDKIAIIKDGGILLGGVSKSILGPFMQAYEVAWWVNPDRRGINSIKMLKMYEEWAKIKGASLIEVKSLENFKEVEKLYERSGYSLIEKSWVKVIK